MSEYVRFEPHGHSKVSDGTDSPKEIAQAAVGKVEVVALSDHDTVEGLVEFLAEIDRINDQKHLLTGVAAVEASTCYGHLIVAVAQRRHSRRFIDWVRKIHHPGINPVDLIIPAAREFDAFCIFAHPAVPNSHGFKLNKIEEVLYQLPSDVTPNLALEVLNNTASAIPIYPWIQARVDSWNRQFRLATVAGSDYHTKYLIGRVFTIVPTSKLIETDIIDSIKFRTAKPAQRERTLRDHLLMLASYGSRLFPRIVSEALLKATRGD